MVPTSNIIEKLCQDRKPRILVLDDMMQQLVEDKSFVEIITKHVHHLNMMVFATMQALHPPGKNAVAIRSQASGYFFFAISDNKRGLRQRFANLADTTDMHNLMKFYDESTKRNGGYIFIDMSQLQKHKSHNVFTNIFPNEGPTIAFE